MFFVLALANCQGFKAPRDGSSSPILFSEVLAGEAGNNNHEFIELYNAADSALDLDGYSLWYRLPSSENDLHVIQWTAETLIPAHGHYLLAREGQEFGIVPNATFKQSLNISGGGLLLRDADGASADAVGWGQAPISFFEGSPIAAPENGRALERLPGGDEGNEHDENNNAADFQHSSQPNPQNTGSPLAPIGERSLTIELQGPATVEPGSAFAYSLILTNISDRTLENISVQLILPPELSIHQIPAVIRQEDQNLYWEIESLPSGSELSESILVEAPWAYLDFLLDKTYAQIGDVSELIFANPILTQIEGGIIPIGTARGLIGAELTIEGIATMYTGGYFAGSGNVKFYLQDESGGLQVQVFAGLGEVSVAIGAHVRVRGTVSVYRDSLQIVPNAVPDDVEILGQPYDGPSPGGKVSIRQAANDMETLPGRLITVEGTITRVEEFTYSFEIDLEDGQGQTLRLYIDKLTEMSVETIERGYLYSSTGILEFRDGNVTLNPRRPSDLQEIIPPVLRVEVQAPNTVLPGETFTVILSATNYSSIPLNNVGIATHVPADLVSIGSISDDGALIEDQITWTISEIGVDGASASVTFQLTALGDAGQIPIEIQASIPGDLVEVDELEPWRIFIGASVPIWAIQGSGFGSPYVLDEVTASGVVTANFPDLGGFWIQTPEGDGSSQTSDGLFIFTDDKIAPFVPGDYVEVSGHVREISQQTMIEVLRPDDIQLLEQDWQIPAAVELDPPSNDEDALVYYESLEGMLVQVTQPGVAVSPTTKYGEYALVLLEHGIDRIWRGREAGHVIMVDDGTFDVHYDDSTLDYVVQSGDQLTGLRGPLAFTFGRYKIEPLQPPQIIPTRQTFAASPLIENDAFNVMTWNVENLFDILAPHPSSPPLPRRAEYELALSKVANTIHAVGAPIIVGLQEVEHVGILEDLAQHAQLREFGYLPILIEGTDGRGIDVGYLVRGDRATIIDVQQFIAPDGLTSRPPLLIQLDINTSRGAIPVYVLNNHFTSMAAGVEATEPRRSNQAAWNVEIIESLIAEDPNANIIILGDLNSFYDSRPIDILRQSGMRHVFEKIDPDERYTYIFEGASQTLDHILVTPQLMEMLQHVLVFHANADYPPPAPDDPSPIHKSDHDPVIAIFAPEG